MEKRPPQYKMTKGLKKVHYKDFGKKSTEVMNKALLLCQDPQLMGFIK